MAMFDSGDLGSLPRFPIRTDDRPLSAEDQELMDTPAAREIALQYKNWGPERIKAELLRRQQQA